MTPMGTSTADRPPLIRKQYALDIGEAKDAEAGADVLGTFEGAASVYNVIDLHGDVIVPGAFDDTLAQKGPERVLLYQHYMDRPIGLANFWDGEHALRTKGQPVRDVRDAEEAWRLVKQKVLRGLSIGFNITGEEWDGGVRHITGVDLWEVSVVTWPANPLAQITNAKSAQDTLAELRSRQVLAEAACTVKAGRVLSKANRRLVEQARDALGALLEAAGDGDDEGQKSDHDTLVSDSSVQLDGLLKEIGSYHRG